MKATSPGRRAGMTFIEMVLCLFILSVISMAAFPLAGNAQRRSREMELRTSLRLIRRAIDRYYAIQEKENPSSDEHARYPRSMDELVQAHLLRRIPIDPVTGRADWIVISTTDRYTVDAPFASDGRNLFDVRSRSSERSARGEAYTTW